MFEWYAALTCAIVPLYLRNTYHKGFLTMSAKQPIVRRRKLTDYQPDPSNPNKDSARSRRLIRQSIERSGAGRSLVADRDDMFIAGNQTVAEAAAAGITDVIEIETEGDVLIVHKRKDLDLDGDDGRARDLSYSDNRVTDFREWRAEQIAADLDAGFDFEHLFRGDELDDLFAAADTEVAVGAAVERGVQGGRLTGERGKQIKPVLYVDEIALFERALRATGIDNRGKAVLEICRAYLAGKGEGDEAELVR